MASRVSLIAQHVEVIASGGKPRPAVEWKDGAATDIPRRAADGRALHRINALVSVDGEGLGEATVLTSEEGAAVLASAAFGQVLVADGPVPVTISAQDQYTVRVSVEALDLITKGGGK